MLHRGSLWMRIDLDCNSYMGIWKNLNCLHSLSRELIWFLNIGNTSTFCNICESFWTLTINLNHKPLTTQSYDDIHPQENSHLRNNSMTWHSWDGFWQMFLLSSDVIGSNLNILFWSLILRLIEIRAGYLIAIRMCVLVLNECIGTCQSFDSKLQ